MHSLQQAKRAWQEIHKVVVEAPVFRVRCVQRVIFTWSYSSDRHGTYIVHLHIIEMVAVSKYTTKGPHIFRLP